MSARQIAFGQWDRAVLEDMQSRYAPAAVSLVDGMTLQTYAGSVPPNWNGDTVEVFDCFEMRRFERHHPDLYREAMMAR